MLNVEGLQAGYGETRVLFDIGFTVGAGEVVTLLGRNGMGKTTTILAVMGLVRRSGGRVLFDREDVTTLPSHRIARRGVGLVPEGRQVFPTLTVRENLVATANTLHGCRWTLERVFDLFPRLAERRSHLGSQLSGGEQQMLAIGRALMTNPKLLILDEATEGLAPLARAEIWRGLARLKSDGHAILLVDKNLETMIRFADRHVVIEKGSVVWTGDSAQLTADASVRRRWLQV